ncbi:MAG: hypothetical protein ACKPKO_61350, partial [Candidatus Fonsibacter sp.]
RQKWSDLMDAKYMNETVKLAFRVIAQCHYERYNRNNIQCKPPINPEDRGTELPLDDNAPKTKL